jgi:hypothetical protein
MLHIHKSLIACVASCLMLALLLSPSAAISIDGVSDLTSDGALPLQNRPHNLTAVKSMPLVVNGASLGTVVVYDDSLTARPDDYVEIYNPAGELVVVAWFDRFGIQRIAVDHAFAEGKAQADGNFIVVVGGVFV